ncbi:MAG: hypothetical protein IPM79_10725 [Polyangiaceae bacterium]|jgi:hypothetical protein|nr:hypothetical protein [Polyangiaceae bacterium]
MTDRPAGPPHPSHLHPARVSVVAGLTALSALASCGDKDKNQTPINAVALPGNASSLDIGTKVGNGRVIETGQLNVPTAVKWTRVFVLDKNRFFLGGHVETEAFALITSDRGATWKALSAPSDGIANWSVGADGTMVLSVAKREIPKKPPPAGELPPIDTLKFLFAAPDQPKISTPVALLATSTDPKERGPVVPRGEGIPAVLGPALVSVVVEMKPKTFVIAYAPGPGEDPLPTIDLPKGETPINAPYGHPPQLVTTNGKQLLVRPWPGPNDKLAEPKPIDKVTLTKTLEGDLSAGPECEWGGWSFRRVMQDKGQTFLLGISPDKTTYFPMPPSIVNTSPIGCSGDKILFEFIDNDKLPRVALCSIDGVCEQPQNRPFKPWAEQHTRELHLAPTPSGMIALQQMRTKVRWTIDMSESLDGGKNFVLQRPVGEGEGGNPEDGYDVGALVSLGDRALFVLSAKVSKTTRRAWYAMASDDNGNTWIMP